MSKVLQFLIKCPSQLYNELFVELLKYNLQPLKNDSGLYSKSKDIYAGAHGLHYRTLRLTCLCTGWACPPGTTGNRRPGGLTREALISLTWQ